MPRKATTSGSKVTLDDLAYFLVRINRRVRIIMATQAELNAKLTGIGDRLDKAIEEIKTSIANSGNTTPETDAAVARLESVSQALDDLNPDQTTTPPAA